MAYKEVHLDRDGAKALMGAWNSGVIGKNAKKKRTVKGKANTKAKK